VIHVRHGWDPVEGRIAPKSAKGNRRVPIAASLRDHLTDRRLAVGDVDPDDLVFGRTASTPFDPKVVTRVADKAWKAAGLERITLHEARHTAVSLLVGAGVNVKAISTYMGHANISITLDRYAHLFPNAEDEAAARLDQFLEAAAVKARAAAPDASDDDGMARELARTTLSGAEIPANQG
jgi:integrase